MSMVHHIALMLLAVIFLNSHGISILSGSKEKKTHDTVVYESGRNVSLPGRN